mgnify:CR=1 FL=1
MKVTINTAPEEYFNCIVRLDGVRYDTVIELDEEKGYIKYYEKDFDNNLTVWQGNHSIKTLYGKVTIEFLGD